MSISVQEFDVQQFRAEIVKMSDAELMSLGRSLHSLCYPRVVAPTKSTFDIQLDECPGRTAQATSAWAAQSLMSLSKYEVVLEQRPHHAALVKHRGTPHKLTGREVYDALSKQPQGQPRRLQWRLAAVSRSAKIPVTSPGTSAKAVFELG
jgi:hypothetical protein